MSTPTHPTPTASPHEAARPVVPLVAADRQLMPLGHTPRRRRYGVVVVLLGLHVLLWTGAVAAMVYYQLAVFAKWEDRPYDLRHNYYFYQYRPDVPYPSHWCEALYSWPMLAANAAVLIAAFVALLLWVGRVHGDMATLTGGRHRPQAANAMGLMFVPLLHHAWLWPILGRLARRAAGTPRGRAQGLGWVRAYGVTICLMFVSIAALATVMMPGYLYRVPVLGAISGMLGNLLFLTAFVTFFLIPADIFLLLAIRRVGATVNAYTEREMAKRAAASAESAFGSKMGGLPAAHPFDAEALRGGRPLATAVVMLVCCILSLIAAVGANLFIGPYSFYDFTSERLRLVGWVLAVVFGIAFLMLFMVGRSRRR